MDDTNDCKELQRRLEQVRRLSSLANDPVTKERKSALVRDLEEQLKEPE